MASSNSKTLPTTMKAIQYSEPKNWKVVEIPLPQMRDTDVLVKVKASGVCGTDLHIHEGDFIVSYPLTPGHETSGVIAAIGPKAQGQGFEVGDSVCAEPSELCDYCYYCRRGELILCENFKSHGLNLPGGAAEYCAFPFWKVYKINNLSFVEATLVEPASCALFGLTRIAPQSGNTCLIFGAGPTGLCLSQLLMQNGCQRVVIAAPEGLKMNLARKLGAADEFIELSRKDSSVQMKKILEDNPHGFNIVIEATGSIDMLGQAINYCSRGGKLVVYGVYDSKAKVEFSPSKIFGDAITIIGSFSEMFQFPSTVAYLDSGRINVKDLVNKTYKLEEYQQCLDDIRSKAAIKAAIVFD